MRTLARIEAAVASYPYADRYTAWPGPNSNSFVAHVLRAVPELKVDLPSTAIGKDYVEPYFVAGTPTGTGSPRRSMLGPTSWPSCRCGRSRDHDVC